uniref:Uncharacterized protein n=1 Tax=Cryptomonas curvata TaxID=233186 RepID=A0A7S0M680_9CRYP|mmetsp:Transcript_26693/g.55397  ORF Transcript_26693/g.55397 Transcript_26693/m.55397 type:complete len:221 (+) Transcript_26693:173-835(+)
MPRIRNSLLNYQPSLNNPLVHLSGATAQQELSEAMNEFPARSPAQRDRVRYAEVVEHEINQDAENVRGRLRQQARNRRRFDRQRLLNANIRLYSGLLACREIIVCKWCVEALQEQGILGAAAELGVWCAVYFLFNLGGFRDDRGESSGSWFNAALSVRLARFVVTTMLGGSTRAFALATAVAAWAVVRSNAASSFLHHFVVVFFQIVVLVQSGNFSCIDA